MKTLFITSFQPFISRNILNTDVLRLLKKEKDLQIVILVPQEKIDFFNEFFRSDSVIIEGMNLDPIRNSKSIKFFHNQAFLFIRSHYNTYTRRDLLKPETSLFGFIKFHFLNFINNVFSHLEGLKKIFRWLDKIITPNNFFEALFEKYKPDLMFATDIYNDFDQALIKESKERNIFCVGMIRSWDNNYSKGLCRYFPDKVLTNNEIIKKEFVKLHGYQISNIVVVGLPQFDDYTKAPFQSREEFFRKIGGDPEKRLILISPAGYPLVHEDADDEICFALKKAQDEDELPKDLQFLIRSHPHRPTKLRYFIPPKNFIVEQNSTSFKTPGKGAEFSPEDKIHLVNSLYYSEVIAWGITTLGIDALAFNKPQIYIDFDGAKNKPYWHSITRYYDEDHMRKFLDTGAVRRARNPQELAYWISKYLKNPHLDEDKRAIAARDQLWKNDGKSGERIAGMLLAELKRVILNH